MKKEKRTKLQNCVNKYCMFTCFLFTLLKNTFSHFKNKAFLKHICSHCFHMFYSNYYNPSVAQLAIITINDFKEQATCSNVYPHKYNRICIYIYNINIYICIYIHAVCGIQIQYTIWTSLFGVPPKAKRACPRNNIISTCRGRKEESHRITTHSSSAIYGCWSKFLYLGTVILREYTCYFRETFTNPMFIFRRAHVGQRCLL